MLGGWIGNWVWGQGGHCSKGGWQGVKDQLHQPVIPYVTFRQVSLLFIGHLQCSQGHFHSLPQPQASTVSLVHDIPVHMQQTYFEHRLYAQSWSRQWEEIKSSPALEILKVFIYLERSGQHVYWFPKYVPWNMKSGGWEKQKGFSSI